MLFRSVPSDKMPGWWLWSSLLLRNHKPKNKESPSGMKRGSYVHWSYSKCTLITLFRWSNASKGDRDTIYKYQVPMLCFRFYGVCDSFCGIERECEGRIFVHRIVDVRTCIRLYNYFCSTKGIQKLVYNTKYSGVWNKVSFFCSSLTLSH